MRLAHPASSPELVDRGPVHQPAAVTHRRTWVMVMKRGPSPAPPSYLSKMRYGDHDVQKPKVLGRHRRHTLFFDRYDGGAGEGPLFITMTHDGHK